MLNGKNVGPYVGVSRDIIKEFPNGEKFRVIIHGAYNAFGLIGCEMNGIAILDENSLSVVADCIEQSGTGYFGPTEEQVETFEKIKEMNWSTFQAFVNSARRLRRRI